MQSFSNHQSFSGQCGCFLSVQHHTVFSPSKIQNTLLWLTRQCITISNVITLQYCVLTCILCHEKWNCALMPDLLFFHFNRTIKCAYQTCIHSAALGTLCFFYVLLLVVILFGEYNSHVPSLETRPLHLNLKRSTETKRSKVIDLPLLENCAAEFNYSWPTKLHVCVCVHV